MSTVHHLVLGPPEHGVTRHALGLLARPELAAHGRTHVRDWQDLGPAPAYPRLPEARLTHAHVTDRIVGHGPEQAAERLLGLAARRRLSVTLHDVPQPAEGTVFGRRATAYAAMAGAAAGVVVASRHERDLLAACGADPSRVVVVPLPIDPLPPPVDPLPDGQPRGAAGDGPGGEPVVAVLGYLYPGKGHAEALAALAGLPPEVSLVALGRASDGHDDLVAQLTAEAAAQGRRFTVTGWLPDEEMTRRLREATVPVAPHRHVSASGSIGTWLAAGRRPVVADGAWVRELLDRCPGSVLLVGEGEDAAYPTLEAAVRACLADPTLTWLPPGVVPGPDSAAVARAYDEVLRGWAR